MSSSSDKTLSILKPDAPILMRLAKTRKYGILWQHQNQGNILKKLFWRRWQRRYVIVAPNSHHEDAPDCFYIYNNRNSKKPAFSCYISSFDMVERDNPVDGEDFCFVLRFKEARKSSLLFACDTEQTLTEWLDVMNKIIKDNGHKGIHVLAQNTYTGVPQKSSNQKTDSTKHESKDDDGRRRTKNPELEKDASVPEYDEPESGFLCVGNFSTSETEIRRDIDEHIDFTYVNVYDYQKKRTSDGKSDASKDDALVVDTSTTVPKTMNSSNDQAEDDAVFAQMHCLKPESNAAADCSDYENRHIGKFFKNKEHRRQGNRSEKTNTDRTPEKQKPEILPKPQPPHGKKETKKSKSKKQLDEEVHSITTVKTSEQHAYVNESNTESEESITVYENCPFGGLVK